MCDRLVSFSRLFVILCRYHLYYLKCKHKSVFSCNRKKRGFFIIQMSTVVYYGYKTDGMLIEDLKRSYNK